MALRGIDIGLMKFCLEHDDSPNLAPTGEALAERSQEDLDWLRKAIDSLEDPMDRAKACLKVLHNDGEKFTNLDEKLIALDELLFYAEDSYMANNIAKEGLGELTNCIIIEEGKEEEAFNLLSDEDKSKVVDIVSGGLWILKAMCQNNDISQSQVLDQGVLQLILTKILSKLRVVDNKDEASQSSYSNQKVLTKLLGFLSAMIRDCRDGQQLILHHSDSLQEKLIAVINSESVKTTDKIKAILVIKHLLVEAFFTSEAITKLILKSGEDQSSLLDCLIQLYITNETDNSFDISTLNENIIALLIAVADQSEEGKKALNTNNIISKSLARVKYIKSTIPETQQDLFENEITFTKELINKVR